jgi:hypothetical protein
MVRYFGQVDGGEPGKAAGYLLGIVGQRIGFGSDSSPLQPLLVLRGRASPVIA